MKTFTLQEAQQNLNKVLEHADEGGTVILIGDDDKAYRLVSTIYTKPGPRQAGRLKGKVKITDEFYEPLPEFEPYTK